jgi:hypothetical protein
MIMITIQYRPGGEIAEILMTKNLYKQSKFWDTKAKVLKNVFKKFCKLSILCPHLLAGLRRSFAG